MSDSVTTNSKTSLSVIGAIARLSPLDNSRRCRAQAAGAVLLYLGGKLGDCRALFGGYLLERFPRLIVTFDRLM